MPNAAEQAAGPVVETFARGSGRWMGYFGIALGIVIAAEAGWHGASHWRTVLIGVAVSILSWAVLVRPEASLRQHGVLFRNIVRDSFIPSTKIEACRTSQTLMVRAEAITYYCSGVSRSARSIMRERAGGRVSILGSFGGLGGGNAQAPAPETEHRYGEELRSTTTYEAYIESRIMSAAQEAQSSMSEDADDADVQPVQAWSWLSLVGLVVVLAAAVGIFL